MSETNQISLLRERMQLIRKKEHSGLVRYYNDPGVLSAYEHDRVLLLDTNDIIATLQHKLINVTIQEYRGFNQNCYNFIVLSFNKCRDKSLTTTYKTITIKGEPIYATEKTYLDLLYYVDGRPVKQKITEPMFIVNERCYNDQFDLLFKLPTPPIIIKQPAISFCADEFIIFAGGQVVWDITYNNEENTFKLKTSDDIYYLINSCVRNVIINYRTGEEIRLESTGKENYSITYTKEKGKLIFNEMYLNVDESSLSAIDTVYCFRGKYYASNWLIREMQQVFPSYITAPMRTKAAIRSAEPEDGEFAQNL